MSDEPPFRSIRVQILGRPYPLRVRPQNEAEIRRIAEYVDERMQAVKRRLPDRPDLTVAVVSALSIAEEMFSTRKSALGESAALEAELEELARRLQSALDEGDSPAHSG